MDNYLQLLKTGWPIEVNDIPPIPGAEKIDVINKNTGMREGVHAGVWRVKREDGRVEIWKSLDVMPYPNSPRRYASREVEALEAGHNANMRSSCGFPLNWVTRLKNDRMWLVRDEAFVIPDYMSGKEIGYEEVLELEQTLRNFNAQGWEIGEHIRVAVDRVWGNPFFLDLSTAAITFDWARDDQRRFYSWCEKNEHEWLSRLRRYCKRLVCSLDTSDNYGKEFFGKYVYVTYMDYYCDGIENYYPGVARTIEPYTIDMYTKEDDLLFYDSQHKCFEPVNSFLITTRPIDPEIALGLRLYPGWAPIEKKWRIEVSNIMKEENDNAK